MLDVLVIGAGPAGVIAALRASDLGAKTALITSGQFGGMATNDGTVPVRTLAYAARLMREAKQFNQYGINISEPQLDFAKLLNRVRDVVAEVRSHSIFQEQINTLGGKIYENAGLVQFIDKNTIQAENGLQLKAEKIIVCTGGKSRALAVPGSQLTVTHDAVWNLTAIPKSLMVIGAGATGVQVASIFNSFGSKVHLFQAGPRIIPSEDEEISTVVSEYFQEAGIIIHEDFGTVDSFQKTPAGIKMIFIKDGNKHSTETQIAVCAIGWMANTEHLQLEKAGINLNEKNFIAVNEYLQTSTKNIFAAGDIIGWLMLVPQAIQDGFIAATNAIKGPTLTIDQPINPIGSFTDPEYAQVGLTESKAREKHQIITAKINFDSTTRTIIDGRSKGFCKLIVDKQNYTILGCHVVGERAVEIIQVAAIAMAGKLRVDELAKISLSFPTYTAVLARVAANAARSLNLQINWQNQH